MKKHLSLLILLFLGLSTLAQNPYLPLWEHLPDGEPRVFEDPDQPGHFRAYIIGSHDVTRTAYCGPDIRMWSAPVENLTQWRDEGPLFTHYVDGQWDTMFAPDLVEVRDPQTGDKVYYLYPHSRGWRRVGTVCRSNRPNGPFTPVNLTPDGRQCLNGSVIDFDPSVFVEPVTDRRDADYNTGFRAYAFYGFKHSTAIELDPKTMYSVRPGTEIHDYFLPASHSYGRLCDPEGMEYPALYAGQNPGEFNFFEASSIRQVGNKYVMVFSGFSGPDYGLSSTNSALRYAYGDSPLGPWRSGGVLVDSRGVVPNEEGTHLTTTNAAHNTHGSLQQINGQWYVFYHRPPRGYGFARQAMVAPVRIEWDKKPVSKGGQVRITAYDPYAKGETWTAKASDGTEYRGAEVTSEGFNIFGLPPYAYYSAGIACWMSDNGWLQDNYDNWDNSQTLKGIGNGGIVGFKYFGFGGLAKTDKGVPAFAGTQKGDGAQLCLNLTPAGNGAFRIRVMLDAPYVNSMWMGRELGVMEVAADAARHAQIVTLPVPQVEGLQGKHAIYLIAESPDGAPSKELFDLHGIGFVHQGQKLQVPHVPQVTILADGQSLRMSSSPIFSTPDNGFTETNRYQLYGRLSEGTRLEVRASDPEVQIHVSDIVEGRATVTCTYRGRKKIFLVN
ncbi:MAG: hypothetical protein ILA39_06505 [Bacteroidaceae bacterium]|nr:hypothetical protein [Bacteroidaceae bacterium]